MHPGLANNFVVQGTPLHQPALPVLPPANGVKCDMNGVYEHVLRIGMWTIQVSDDSRDVEILSKKKLELQPNINQYHLRINSKRNKAGLCRSMFLLEDHHNKIVNSTCLLQ